MAIDKLVDSSQLDNNLTLIANAIRAKGGTSASLSFPTEYITAINAIPSGGSSGYTRTVIIPEQTVTPNSDRQATLSGVTDGFVDASHYIVTLDGVEWYGTCEALWGTNLTVGEAQWFWNYYLFDTIVQEVYTHLS